MHSFTQLIRALIPSVQLPGHFFIELGLPSSPSVGPSVGLLVCLSVCLSVCPFDFLFASSWGRSVSHSVHQQTRKVLVLRTHSMHLLLQAWVLFANQHIACSPRRTRTAVALRSSLVLQICNAASTTPARCLWDLRLPLTLLQPDTNMHNT